MDRKKANYVERTAPSRLPLADRSGASAGALQVLRFQGLFLPCRHAVRSGHTTRKNRAG